MATRSAGVAAVLRRSSLQTSQLLKSRCNFSTGGSLLAPELSENRRSSSSHKGNKSTASQLSPARNKVDGLRPDKPNRQSKRPHADQAQHKTASRQSRPSARPGFVITTEARTHYQVDGKFRTSPENYEWFRQTGIIPDNNDKWFMRGLDKAFSRRKAFHATFSTKHFVDPVHTQYFAPHPVPRVVALRAEYERKLSKPLWVYAMGFTDDRAVVRSMAKRKLVGYMYEAREILLKEGIHVRGTVLFTIWSAITILKLEKDELLKLFVDALRHEASRQPQPEHSSTRTSGEGPDPVPDDIEDCLNVNVVADQDGVQPEAASRDMAAQLPGEPEFASDGSSTQQDPTRLLESTEKDSEVRLIDRILKVEQNRQRSQVDSSTSRRPRLQARGQTLLR